MVFASFSSSSSHHNGHRDIEESAVPSIWNEFDDFDERHVNDGNFMNYDETFLSSPPKEIISAAVLENQNSFDFEQFLAPESPGQVQQGFQQPGELIKNLDIYLPQQKEVLSNLPHIATPCNLTRFVPIASLPFPLLCQSPMNIPMVWPVLMPVKQDHLPKVMINRIKNQEIKRPKTKCGRCGNVLNPKSISQQVQLPSSKIKSWRRSGDLLSDLPSILPERMQLENSHQK